MSQKITLEEFNSYTKNYYETCIEKLEEDGTFIKSFKISRSALTSIFEAAESSEIRCESVRIYFAKKSGPTEYDLEREKFYTEGDYNLVIIGLDEEGRPITSTGEIYDNLSPCPPNC